MTEEIQIKIFEPESTSPCENSPSRQASPFPPRKRDNFSNNRLGADIENNFITDIISTPSPATSPRQGKGRGWAKIKRELITKQKQENPSPSSVADITTTTTTAVIPASDCNPQNNNNNNNCENMNSTILSKSPSPTRKHLDVFNGNNSTFERKKMRLLILGQDGVGKSAFIVRYLTRRFIGEYDPLLEGVFRKHITLNNQEILVEMKDTAKGINWQNRVADVIWADALIFVYSITDKNSFNEIQKYSKQIEQQRKNRGIPCLIIGNKKDLSHERDVSFIEGSKLASSLNSTFCELSVSDNYIDLEGVINHLVKEYGLDYKQSNQMNQLKILTSKSSPEILEKQRDDKFTTSQLLDFPKGVMEVDECKSERKSRALWQKLLISNDVKKGKK